MSPKEFHPLNMSSYFLSLFLALLLFTTASLVFVNGLIQASRTPSFNSNGSEIDRISLLAIKSQLHDPLENLASWNYSLDHCKWQGVMCGLRHRRVTVLDLNSLSLVGMLSPFIGNLSFLRVLHITNNTFQGQLPPELGHLSRLHGLIVANNSFTGQIPPNLGHCLNLTGLVLGGNELVGRIPSQLGSLSKLKILHLGLNRLSGDISVVGNLTSLYYLVLADNAFSGSIPNTLGRLKHLNFLDAAVNNLSGPIPPSFYNLSSLTDLEISENRLEGSLHQDIGLMLPHLYKAQFSFNSLSGLLPSSLSNLSKIQVFEAAQNHFSGKITINGEKWPELFALLLASNNLGLGDSNDLKFLESLVNCSELHMLQLSENNLGGELPSSVSNLSKTLEVLDVEYNQIGGSIPSHLSKLANLYWLNLGSNQFTGTIPNDVGSLKLLSLASFQVNKFVGSIPLSFGNLSMLSKLYLSFNQLQGRIPSSIGNCSNLLELTLGENRLTGVIPSQLFAANAPLYLLGLDGNQFEGRLPNEIAQSKSLTYFSVSSNKLSGEIPESLGSCTNLRELNMSDNFFKGTIPGSFSALRSLELLDLSANNLSGPIPSYFSNFPLSSLNLSSNNFEGEVPTDGIFSNKSIVSLEGNPKLCGGVVELHLSKCIPRKTKPSNLSHKKWIMIISVAGGGVGIATIAVIIFSMMKKKSRNLSHPESLFPQERFLKMSYEMLLKATAGFAPANLIGEGSYGSVYKGVTAISDGTEMPIAVKVLNLKNRGSSKSFIAECKALRTIRHRNLVKIISACSSIDFKGNDFKALIYEFISNGSLEQWLYPSKETDDPHGRFQKFSLLHRVNVAIDMASVLDYLHSGCETAIVHCDIKPSNILLDEDMTAHLADFGLSRLVDDIRDQNRSSSTLVKGTVGYAAPEYGLGSRVSTKGDVYSFGILLLELMVRKKPTDPMFNNGLDLHKLAEMALQKQDQMINIVDGTLTEDDNGATNQFCRHDPRIENCRKIECIASILKIGVACSMENPEGRANLYNAVSELKLAKDVLLGARAVPNRQTS